MELIDILTPDGQATGVVKSRAQVHTDGDWHRTVHVWIINSEHELLLQKRAALKASHPGMWDVSCAGHIAAGDSSPQAAVRELREELGLYLQPEILRFLFTVPSLFLLNHGTFIDRELVDVYMLTENIDPRNLKLQPEEVEAVAWVPLKTFRTRVEQSDPSLVPHTEAYRRLFAHLDQEMN